MTDYGVTTAHLPEFKSTSAARVGVTGDLEAYSGLLDQSPKSHVTKSLLKTCFQSTASVGWFTWHWCVHQLRLVTLGTTLVWGMSFKSTKSANVKAVYVSLFNAKKTEAWARSRLNSGSICLVFGSEPCCICSVFVNQSGCASVSSSLQVKNAKTVRLWLELGPTNSFHWPASTTEICMNANCKYSNTKQKKQ